MPTCPACATVNPAGFSFCGHCATPLASRTCPSCGTPNPDDGLFCGWCGSPLDGDASPPSVAVALQERKLATVLFADVVGFTSLSEQTDPEVVATMVDTAFRRMAEVVVEHGGTVDKYMGDSIMAVFGVPVAHDEDAERAVAAGLAMRSLGGDLAFSIGINSGEVMATALGRAGDMTVIGDTVNVAARLEKAAGAGEVLCGRMTADLAGRRVVFRDRQPVLFKGKQEPVGVWEAVSLRPFEPGGEPDEPPLVGRDDELAFLEAQWRRVVRDSKAQVLVLCGEAGAGKSRLIDELACRVAKDGLVIRATYPAYGPTGSGRVAKDIVRQLGSFGDAGVDARVRSISGEMEPSLKSIDPAGIAREQIWAFSRLLEQKARDRPILLAIEGMHRSGERSLELLSGMAARVDDVPLLLVFGGRTDPPDWLSWFPTATTVSVGPLSRADAATLAGALFTDKPLAPDAVQFLVDRANGNPLYLRELVATARARGALVAEGGVYHLSAQEVIPPSLHALLAARLDALEPAQKLVVQQVAVLGVAATATQLTALGGSDPRPALRTLVGAGLLRHSSIGEGYDVEDPLLREVAYETLPHTLRGALHRRAAAVSDGPEELARHLDRAADYLPGDAEVAAEAAEALAQLGATYAQASRQRDVIRVLERAVALGFRGPDGLLMLANAQSTCGRGPDALSTLGMISDDAERPELAAERDHAAASVFIFSDPAAALPGLRVAAQRWAELANPIKEAWAHANAGVALFNLSRMAESTSELEISLDLFESVGDRAGTVSASSFLCLAHPADPRVAGWLSDALAYADQAGDRSRQQSALVALAWHHYFLALAGGPVDMLRAESLATRLALLAEELGFAEIAVHGWSLRSTMARFTGRLDEAAECAASAAGQLAAEDQRDSWLGWAASFGVTLASGASHAAAPLFPTGSVDPVVSIASAIVNLELALAGRVDEALSRFEGDGKAEIGPLGELPQLFYALTLVLAGRDDEAMRWVKRTARAADILGAAPAALAAAALRADITGNLEGLPAPPPDAAGLADALVLRAYARRGDRAAAATMARAARELAMPALLIGI